MPRRARYGWTRGRRGAGRNHTAKGGVVVAGPTPPPGEPIHWWDLSDVAQLYSDDEATSLIAGGDGNVIRAITDKGSDPLTMTVEGAGGTHVTFDAAWAETGQSAGNFDCTSAAPDLGMFTAKPATDEGTTGWIACAIWSINDAEQFTKAVGSGGDNAAILTIVDDAWHSFSGGGKEHKTDISDNQIIGSIFDHKQSDTVYTSRHSGDDEILTATGIFTDFESAADEFKLAYVQQATTTNLKLAEYILYEGNMADNGLADEDFMTYLSDKYGIVWTVAT